MCPQHHSTPNPALSVLVPVRCRRLEALLTSMVEQPLAPAALLQQVRPMVDACFASMLRYCRQHGRLHQACAPAAAAAAAAAGDDEATSAPATAAGAALAGSGAAERAQDKAAGRPAGPVAATLTPGGMRALLLQQVPVPLAELRRQHSEAGEEGALRRLAHRFLLELLLRFCICACGERALHTLCCPRQGGDAHSMRPCLGRRPAVTCATYLPVLKPGSICAAAAQAPAPCLSRPGCRRIQGRPPAHGAVRGD